MRKDWRRNYINDKNVRYEEEERRESNLFDGVAFGLIVAEDLECGIRWEDLLIGLVWRLYSGVGLHSNYWGWRLSRRLWLGRGLGLGRFARLLDLRWQGFVEQVRARDGQAVLLKLDALAEREHLLERNVQALAQLVQLAAEVHLPAQLFFVANEVRVLVARSAVPIQTNRLVRYV